MRRLRQERTALKEAVRKSEAKRSKSASYAIHHPPTPVFKPSAIQIPSQQAQHRMMPPHQQAQVNSSAEVIEISGDSTYFDTRAQLSCDNQSSEYYDASSCGTFATSSPKTPENACAVPSSPAPVARPRRVCPNDGDDNRAVLFQTPPQSCPSPRTPENLPDACPTPPMAPRRPSAQSRRGNFSQRAADSGTPRSHQVRVVIDHPKAPGVRRIELDHNVDDEDIETVNRIIMAMAPGTFDNTTVSVTAKNAKILPGKYKLYKNLRF